MTACSGSTGIAQRSTSASPGSSCLKATRTGYGYWSKPVLAAVTHMIGFCGKAYPMLEIAVHDGLDEKFRVRCWSLQDVDSFLHRCLTNEAWAEFCNREKRYRRPVFYDIKGRREKCKKFFEECAEKIDSYKDMFEKSRSPIFVAKNEGRACQIEYNAILKPYDFFKIFDTAAAWMELSMYVNNLAVPIKDLPKIDDKTLAECKGFDKFSFRKDKAKR